MCHLWRLSSLVPSELLDEPTGAIWGEMMILHPTNIPSVMTDRKLIPVKAQPFIEFGIWEQTVQSLSYRICHKLFYFFFFF